MKHMHSMKPFRRFHTFSDLKSYEISCVSDRKSYEFSCVSDLKSYEISCVFDLKSYDISCVSDLKSYEISCVSDLKSYEISCVSDLKSYETSLPYSLRDRFFCSSQIVTCYFAASWGICSWQAMYLRVNHGPFIYVFFFFKFAGGR